MRAIGKLPDGVTLPDTVRTMDDVKKFLGGAKRPYPETEGPSADGELPYGMTPPEEFATAEPEPGRDSFWINEKRPEPSLGYRIYKGEFQQVRKMGQAGFKLVPKDPNAYKLGNGKWAEPITESNFRASDVENTKLSPELRLKAARLAATEQLAAWDAGMGNLQMVADRLPFSPTGAVGWLQKGHAKQNVEDAKKNVYGANATTSDYMIVAQAEAREEFEQYKMDAAKSGMTYGEWVDSRIGGASVIGGEIASQAPAFIVEMGLTSGALGGARVGPRVAIAAKLVMPATRARSVGRAAELLTKVVANVSMTPNRVGESIGRQQYEKDRRGTAAALYGLGDTLTEAFTEIVGGKLIGSTIRAVGGDRIMRATVGRWMKSKSPNRSMSEIDRTLRKSGYDGKFMEMAEERLGEIIRGITGIEDDYGVFTDLATGQYEKAAEQLVGEMIGFAFPEAFAYSANKLLREEATKPVIGPNGENLDETINKAGENIDEMSRTEFKKVLAENGIDVDRQQAGILKKMAAQAQKARMQMTQTGPQETLKKLLGKMSQQEIGDLYGLNPAMPRSKMIETILNNNPESEVVEPEVIEPETAEQPAIDAEVIEPMEGEDIVLDPKPIVNVEAEEEAEDIIESYKQDPELKNLIESDAGVKEGYTVESHTKMVLDNWEKQSSPKQLSEIEKRSGINGLGSLMRHVVALHDIGKPIAIAEGDKRKQHEKTLPILEKQLKEKGFDAKSINLAKALVGNDAIGELIQGKIQPSQAYLTLNALAKKTGVEPSDLFSLQTSLYKADAGSYPGLRGSIFIEGPSGKLTLPDVNFGILEEMLYGRVFEADWTERVGEKGKGSERSAANRGGSGRQYVHGSSINFDSYDESKDSGKNRFGKGLYLVDEADGDVASHYAVRSINRILRGAGFQKSFIEKVMSLPVESLNNGVKRLQEQSDKFSKEGNAKQSERYATAAEVLSEIAAGRIGKHVLPVDFSPSKVFEMGAEDSGGRVMSINQLTEIISLLPDDVRPSVESAVKRNPRTFSLYNSMSKALGSRDAATEVIRTAGYDAIQFVHIRGGYNRPYNVMVSLIPEKARIGKRTEHKVDKRVMQSVGERKQAPLRNSRFMQARSKSQKKVEYDSNQPSDAVSKMTEEETNELARLDKILSELKGYKEEATKARGRLRRNATRKRATLDQQIRNMDEAIDKHETRILEIRLNRQRLIAEELLQRNLPEANLIAGQLEIERGKAFAKRDREAMARKSELEHKLNVLAKAYLDEQGILDSVERDQAASYVSLQFSIASKQSFEEQLDDETKRRVDYREVEIKGKLESVISSWNRKELDFEGKVKAAVALAKDKNWRSVLEEESKKLAEANEQLLVEARKTEAEKKRQKEQELRAARQAQALEEEKNRPAPMKTSVTADIMLDSWTLNRRANPKLAKIGMELIKGLYQTVPEFRIRPIFVVSKSKKLVYRNAYAFALEPVNFNLDPADLKEGMTVGANLEDLGLVKSSEQDVVISSLKSSGFKVTRSGKNVFVKFPVNGGGKAVSVKVEFDGKKWNASSVNKSRELEVQLVIDSFDLKETVGPEPKSVKDRADDFIADTFMADLSDEGYDLPLPKVKRERDETNLGQMVSDEKFAVSPVEIVSMVRALGFDVIAKNYLGKGVRGAFSLSDGKQFKKGDILIKRNIQSPDQFYQTLSHEFGHFMDWLEQNDGEPFINKDNPIVSRLLALKSFKESIIAPFPGAPGAFTQEERDELFDQIKRGMTTEFEQEVDEEIETVTGLTPEDIIRVWNSSDAHENADLMTYIKRLSTAEKKALVMQAMAGMVPEDLKKFQTVVKTKTGNKIKTKIKVEPSDEEIYAAFNAKLKSLIKERGLIEEMVLLDELKKLSAIWRPWDRAESSAEFAAYRDEPVELYADGVSAILKNPGLARRMAPQFFKTWFAYLGEKPKIATAYLELQRMMSGDTAELAIKRTREFHEMYDSGDNSYAQSLETVKVSITDLLSWMKRGFLDRAAGIKDIAIDEQDARRIDEYYKRHNKNTVMLSDIQHLVLQPLEDMGIDRYDIGDWLVHNRIVSERFEKNDDEVGMFEAGDAGVDLSAFIDPNEGRKGRSELLNPGGYTPEQSQEQLDALRARLGDDKYKALVAGMRKFQGIFLQQVANAVDSGLIPQELYDNVIEPNFESYATFAVLNYVENGIGWQVHEQSGTLKDIMNPFEAMTAKAMAMNRMAERNRAVQAVINIMYKHPEFREEIKALPKHRVSKGKPIGMPRKDHVFLVVYNSGKQQWYEVPSQFASMFKGQHEDIAVAIGEFIQTNTYRVMHPLLVTMSVGFGVKNPVRDLLGTSSRAGSKYSLPMASIAMETAKLYGWAWKQTGGQVPMDARMKDMLEGYAIGTSYTSIDAHIADEAGLTKRAMQEAGIIEVKPSKYMPVRAIKNFYKLVEHTWETQELAGKAAVWNMLLERGYSRSESAAAVRTLAGTPDYDTRGVLTSWTNTLLPYSKVRWNGLRSELSIATDKSIAPNGRSVRSAYFMKLLLRGVIPALIAKMLGDIEPFKTWLGWGWRFDPITDYVRSRYNAIPVWMFGEKGEQKALTLTIPMDETTSVVHGLTMHLIDAGLESAGQNTRNVNNLRESLNDIVSLVVPSWNPAADVALQGSAYALTGKEPYDSFFGRSVIGRNTPKGWESHKEVMAWALSKTGAFKEGIDTAAFLVKTLTNMTGLTEKDPMDKSSTINKIPGVKVYLRMQAGGLNEFDRALKEKQDQNNRLFNSRLPEIAVRLASEYRYLQSKVEPTEIDDARKAKLKAFYSAYLRRRKNIKRYEEAGDEANAKEQRQELQEYAREFIN